MTRNQIHDIDNFSITSIGKSIELQLISSKNSPDKRRRQIGNNLNRLRTDRNKVDYDDHISNL
ncbi:MAG: hypothetical protein ACTSRP_10815 [Candidatus Helarchaeota archaeon]